MSKKTTAALFAAVLASATLTGLAAPAEAHQYWGGYGWRYAHGWRSGPYIGGAFGALALGAAVAASQSCYGSAPVYDGWGRFLGYRSYYVC